MRIEIASDKLIFHGTREEPADFHLMGAIRDEVAVRFGLDTDTLCGDNDARRYWYEFSSEIPEELADDACELADELTRRHCS